MNLRSHIVYKYKCANCNIDYVGQTFLQLKMRAFNSMGISFRTNLPNSQPENLAVRDHYDLNRHRISLQKFSILQNASKGEELKNLESFYICLLYTSDAADERSSVDLGGRRII